jgi:hypothetical protein
MARRLLESLLSTLTLVLVSARLPLTAQPPDSATLSPGIERLAGTDAPSQIHYIRLILKGSLHTAVKGAPDPAPPDPPPLLIAQCTQRPGGKYLFEIFATFGGPVDLAFYPPWKPSSRDDLFPPRTEKSTVTMDFLGYTHVKPFRRQWEVPIQTPGLLRYNPPSGSSPNLEEFSFFLRYLVSLPTLRLTLGTRSAEFLTTPLLAEIRAEPLCRAAGL